MSNQKAWDDDKAIPEDAAIKAAHPLRSGRHDIYQEAMRMVGAKHSKGGLVELVNWLLVRAAKAEESAVRWVVKIGVLYWDLSYYGDTRVGDQRHACKFVQRSRACAIARLTGGRVVRLVAKVTP